MLVFHAGGADNGIICDLPQHGAVNVDLAEHLPKLLGGDTARAQQPRALTRQVDYGRFHADAAGTAVDHRVDLSVRAVIVQDVLRGGGGGLAGEVCRRCGNGNAGLPNQLTRHRRLRAADGNGVQICGGAAGNAVPDRQDHRQRSGPKFFRQMPRTVRNIVTVTRQLGRLGDMDDERVILRTPLGFENLRDRSLVRCVCAQTVDRLGRDGDDAARADDLGCNARRLRVKCG